MTKEQLLLPERTISMRQPSVISSAEVMRVSRLGEETSWRKRRILSTMP